MGGVTTLGEFKANGMGLTAYCREPDCRRFADLDMEDLIRRLGVDFRVVGPDRPLDSKLRCTRCGRRNCGAQVTTGNGAYTS